MTKRSLGILAVLSFSFAAFLSLGCGDDTGGGSACESAEDCEAVECPDGSTVRACVSQQCQTNADDVCAAGEGGGSGW